MNKRIKELAEQAKCYADENNAHYLQNQHWIETFEEKFAELIVKECINRIEQNRSSGENTDFWTITRDMAFHQMKTDLAEHFGVEE